MSDSAKKPGFEDLVELMARLRGPEGCPWDRDQTPETLTPYILEEAHELVEAIREQDPAHVCEELGDLLFQIIFQAQIAAETKDFDASDVTAAIHEKMTARHPHVFGDVEVKSAEEVRKNWVRQKEREGRAEKDSALGQVPRSLPALLRGRRITVNAAEVGFDWSRTEEVMAKVEEEWQELKQSLAEGSAAEIEAEFGDLLFGMVNLSRFLKLDPEQALNRAIDKFARRFKYLEAKAAASGRRLESVSLAEMETYWEEAKRRGI